MEKGAFILSGIDTVGLLQAMSMTKAEDFPASVPDYMDTNVSTKVVKIIQSYIGITMLQ